MTITIGDKSKLISKRFEVYIKIYIYDIYKSNEPFSELSIVICFFSRYRKVSNSGRGYYSFFLNFFSKLQAKQCQKLRLLFEGAFYSRAPIIWDFTVYLFLDMYRFSI